MMSDKTTSVENKFNSYYNKTEVDSISQYLSSSISTINNKTLCQINDNTTYKTNLLYIDINNQYGDVNRTRLFGGKNITNAPPITGEFIGEWKCIYKNSSHILVQLTEFYPKNGRIWTNFYNTGKWYGWSSNDTSSVIGETSYFNSNFSHMGIHGYSNFVMTKLSSNRCNIHGQFRILKVTLLNISGIPDYFDIIPINILNTKFNTSLNWVVHQTRIRKLNQDAGLWGSDTLTSMNGTTATRTGLQFNTTGNIGRYYIYPTGSGWGSWSFGGLCSAYFIEEGAYYEIDIFGATYI